MGMISRKKQPYPISPGLRAYLRRHRREVELPIRYEDLTYYGDTIPVYDKRGRDTLWESVLYPAHERRRIHRELVGTYASLRVTGERGLMEHLVTDRVDVCSYGNTQPFRVRILNTLNENFDYFYVKKADASRVYGLELEHILSPNRLEFMTCGDTLVEEHIAGIPGETFMREYLEDKHLDEVRLAKEFVKFTERCFVRLLGDMHSGNFVVDITPDFDETSYRLRAIDFDQQSYESNIRVYQPNFYIENNPIVFLGMKCMEPKTTLQYQQEERSLIRHRARTEAARLRDLLDTMKADHLAPEEHLIALRDDLATHYDDPSFRACASMGALVEASLATLGWEPSRGSRAQSVEIG
ncbi:hypothetical protein PPSIR1_39635 [Plesiocystis pacifica SIR-1]|uniref:Protein kinase n=1 Tax=Plesiocystis pacifica SIR-1 TaxID=391625 RepID=A6FY57_9BACT|nr:hypothetical protein [Plesiocystis pacifica]EDM81436.1 hypothetical protein PPSIR1_39635 [Plesiocystis pacifica SIR-1]